MNDFIEACIKKRLFNQNSIKELKQECSNTNILLSFPRSGNGWVRVILATYFSIYEDSYFKEDQLQKLETFPLQNEQGLKTAVLSVKNEISIPIDLYVPDIYQYKKTLSASQETKDLNILSVKPKNIFKSHHLGGDDDLIKSYGIILREPGTCALSASLLLESNLLSKDIGEINNSVQYYLDSYIKYLKGYIELYQSKKASFIFHDLPSEGIANWLYSSFYDSNGDRDLIEARLKSIISHFPLKSGFNKEIAQIISTKELNDFDLATSLFNQIKGFSN